MRRLAIPLLLFVLTANWWQFAWAAEPQSGTVVETKYLTFQIQTGLYGWAGPPPMPGRFALSKAQLEDFVRDVVKAIGMTGDARHKLGFAAGPLCFNMSDEETRQFIHDAFAVARENDAAVALHIDDSIMWGERKDLLSNPDNIETADWQQIPNTGRRCDWGPKPTKFTPQMCFNSPAIQAAVKARAALIGTEVNNELVALKTSGKGHLFAGTITGWETQMGRDFDTDRALGYRALQHRGFSESNPPKDADLERVSVVKEWMELWANSLHSAGIPREKIFCHIVFTSQGLDPKNLKTGGGSKFSPAEVAFSSAYRPGFSTYPEGETFKAIYAALAAHGSPGWISGEGVNVSPAGMPGEANMETYLGRMFNHGAVMTNIFSWGIGGESMRNNFFRKATESPECLSAYAKFLRGETLVESANTGFSAANLQAKMQRIQAELPAWIQKSGKRGEAAPLMEQIKSLVKEKKWQEVDKAADQVLQLIDGGKPDEAATSPAKSEPRGNDGSEDFAEATRKRLTGKVERIKQGAQQWAASGRDPSEIGKTMGEEFKRLMEAGKVVEAEAVLDRVLKQLEQDESSTATSAAAGEAVQQRVAAKVERVTQDVQKWAAIAKTMEERVKPLLETGKFVEAEAELDRVLEQRTKETNAPATAPPIPQDASSYEERLPPKIHRIQEALPAWSEKPGNQEKATAFMQKLKEQLDAMNFAEADKTADSILETMGLSTPAAGQSGETKPPQSPPPGSPSNDTAKRVTEKVRRITEAVRKMSASGRDPSAILKTMQEKVGPLLDAGNIADAEVEIDRVLELLKEDTSAPAGASLRTQEPAVSPEKVADGYGLAEGPVWDGEQLLFCDVSPSVILKLGSDGTVSTVRSDTRKGAGLAFDSKGRLLICEVDGRCVTRVEHDGTQKTLAESYNGKKLNGPNDLTADDNDGIYFTDPLFLNVDKREQDKEAVYYINPEGTVLRVANDLEKPNGIALSVDGKKLFVADTATTKLRAYPVKADGTLGDGRDVGSLTRPDGVKVDRDGNVYVAGREGIVVWDASGRRLGTLKIPEPPNNLAFGDRDRRTIFITTNRSIYKIRLDRALATLTPDESSVPKDSP